MQLDGRRVGELTALVSQRYGGHVDAVLRRGGRPGAVGLVVDGRRGVEVELRLPEASSDETVDTTSPLPPVLPRPTPRGPDGGRPSARPRRFRKPLLIIIGGVVALLVVIGAVAGCEGEVRDTATPAVSTAVPETRQPQTRTPDPEPVRDVAPEPRRPAPEPAPEPDPEPEPSGGSTSYANCSEVRAAGAAPIRAGEPGDSRKLDRDGDGVGCDT